MARTVWGAHKRYMETYLTVYRGLYFTGDGAGRDHEGYYWIRGRVDDVVNVSGHRLSTAEIEAALIEHSAVAEAAVVGVSDELTGQAVNAFVSLKDGNEHNEQIRKDLILQVRKSIGPFAAPKAIYTVPDLPKTRSGKIMRRILRKILAGEEDQLGDTSTVRGYPLIRMQRTAETLTRDVAVGPECCRQDYRSGACNKEEVGVPPSRPYWACRDSFVGHGRNQRHANAWDGPCRVGRRRMAPDCTHPLFFVARALYSIVVVRFVLSDAI